MKNKTSLTKIVIVAIILLIMFIPIFKDMANNSLLKTIDMETFSGTNNDGIVKKTESYKYAIVYVDSSDNEKIKDLKKELKKIVDSYKTDEKEINAYYMDSKEMSSADFTKLGLNNSKKGYVFIANGEILYSNKGLVDKKELKKLVSLYTASGVSKDLVNYKTAKNAKEYLNLVKGKKITMAIFGRTNCYYCQQFLPVYNTVAKEYKVDIYYFDQLKYDEKEYNKIMSSGLKVPASCNEEGKESKLEDGFGTPLTLFTKKGKVIDCIAGYNNKKELVKKLESVGLIKTNDSSK